MQMISYFDLILHQLCKIFFEDNDCSITFNEKIKIFDPFNVKFLGVKPIVDLERKHILITCDNSILNQKFEHQILEKFEQYGNVIGFKVFFKNAEALEKKNIIKKYLLEGKTYKEICDLCNVGTAIVQNIKNQLSNSIILKEKYKKTINTAIDLIFKNQDTKTICLKTKIKKEVINAIQEDICRLKK